MRTYSLAIALAVPMVVLAQGTISDYERAQQFLPGNLRHLVSFADITPHWIKESDRFWYRRVDAKGVEFVLVDAAQNTAAPAFDHVRLAEAFKRASQREAAATELPFHDFDFAGKGNAIEFEAEGAQWTCDLDKYDCKQLPHEDLSPDRRWSAL